MSLNFNDLDDIFMILRPIYTTYINDFIDKPQIKIITGIRRFGKSTVLKSLKKELLKRKVEEDQIVFINLESFNFSHLFDARSLYNYIQEKITTKKRYYLLIDEIQEVENWEKAIILS